MKIIYIVHSFPPFHWRGTEVYAMELATAMADMHEAGVFYLVDDQEAEGVTLESDTFNGLCVHRARMRIDPANPENYFFNPELEKVFTGLLNSMAPDVVHFLYYTGGLSLSLPVIAKRSGAKVYITVTDFSGLCPRGQLLDGEGKPCPGPREGTNCMPCLFDKPIIPQSPRLDRLARKHLPPRLVSESSRPELALIRKRLRAVREAFKSAQLVIYPNRNITGHYHNAGISAGRETVMDYGIDTTPFAGHKKSRSEVTRIGFVGQLLPHKGLHVLAKALTGLAGEWRLSVYGRIDDPGAKDYYNSIGLPAERVEFKGTFPFEAMNSVLADIDVLVVPSQWDENCPLIVKYAIATGTRALLADQPGMVAERSGLSRVTFFKPTDPDSLHSALASAMEEDAGPAAQGGAVTDIRDQAKKFEAIYKEAVGKKADEKE